MAGSSDIDPEKCARYAGLMASLSRDALEAIYWVLFCSVLLMLLYNASHYSRCVLSPVPSSGHFSLSLADAVLYEPCQSDEES